MDNYPDATKNLKRIANEIQIPSSKGHIGNEILSRVIDEIASTNEQIQRMVNDNDNNQAKILSILIKKINKLEDILK